MTGFTSIVLRELRIAFGSGSLAMPIIFFVAVAAIYPFAVGSDPALLARTGGGVLWVAALLAALLPVERLVAPDSQSGVIDALRLSDQSDEIIVSAKLVGHWLAFAPPLLLATLPASLLLGLPSDQLASALFGLAIATPALAALGVLAACLIAGLPGGHALAGLIVIPLAVPILIFGAGMFDPLAGGAWQLLAAVSLLLVAITPFAGGAALRAARGA